MQDNDSLLRQYGAKYGLILGLCFLVLAIGGDYFTANVVMPVVGFVLTQFFVYVIAKIALAVVFVLWLRKTLGGYWNLKQATTGIFFMLYMALIINYIGYNIAFTHAIDPATFQKAGQHTIDAFKQAQQMGHTPQKDIDAKVQSMQQSLHNGYQITVSSVLQYLFTYILLVFVVSLVLGALFKRELPVFTRTREDVE